MPCLTRPSDRLRLLVRIWSARDFQLGNDRALGAYHFGRRSGRVEAVYDRVDVVSGQLGVNVEGDRREAWPNVRCNALTLAPTRTIWELPKGHPGRRLEEHLADSVMGLV